MGIGKFYPRRAVENLIVNPQCLIAQEGTSFAAMSSGDYVLDGFKYVKSGSMVHTGSQVTDNPAATNRLCNGYKAVKLDCTTADASIAAGDYCALVSFVEGFDALRCYEVPFVLTFQHCHTKTGTYCVAITNSAGDRTIVKEYTQAVADTWEKTTLVFTASPSAGTWNFTTGVGFEIRFCLAGGSTYQTTADAWNTGNYYATSNQVNACDSTANNFLLTDVALYPGSRNLGFYAPEYDDQLEHCRRYFEKSYDSDVDPGDSSAAAASGAKIRWSHDTYTLYNKMVDFETRKRVAPTVLLYSPQTGASGKVAQHSGGDTYESDKTSIAINKSESNYEFSGGGNIAAEKQIHFHYTADARF